VLGADRTARPGLVVEQHTLAEQRPGALHDQARRDVRRSARRIGHDDANLFRRPFLGGNDGGRGDEAGD
jgi:hypothetical protein